MILHLLQQVVPPPVQREVPGFMRKILDFLDTPAPYSPFTEYLFVLFILWLLARRERKKPDFSAEAQSVLDEKYKRGEINKKTYDKYRQELTVRQKE